MIKPKIWGHFSFHFMWILPSGQEVGWRNIESEASPATPCGFSASSDPKRAIYQSPTRAGTLCIHRRQSGKVRRDRTKDVKKREGGTDKDNDNSHCRNQYSDGNGLKHVCNIGYAPSNNSIHPPWRIITKSILKFYSNIYIWTIL